MSILCCPVCRSPLQRLDKLYRCPKGHSFDRAAKGYVNLLLSHEMNSKTPGDSPEMVRARTAFLDGGYYSCLRRGLADLCLKLLGQNGQKSPSVIDTGCGEGYYTLGIYETLCQSGFSPQMAGIDLSKAALKHASGRCREIEYAISSLFHLPAADGSVQLITDVFAPVAPQEFARVLAPGGYVVVAAPGVDHLWGMKQVVYEKPYANDDLPPEMPGFTLVEKVEVSDNIVVPHQRIPDLFAMTPYFWKSPREGTAKLMELEELKTPISFSLFVFQKNS